MSITGTSGTWSVVAGEFDPSTIVGLRWWLDASDAATFSYVSGTQVHTWSDKSGNGHHAVQVSGGDGTGPERIGTLNGLPTVVWDGACWAIGDESIPTDTQPNTVFIVARVTTLAWSAVLDGGNVVMRRQGFNGTFGFDAGTAAGYTLDNSEYHIFTAVFNGASSLQRIDGAQVGTTNTGTGVFTKYKLGADGGDNRLNGAIAEVLICDASLSAGDITDVETYLIDKWGLDFTFRPSRLVGLIGWYDALRSNFAPSQWSDESGTGRHVVQATTGNQPTLVADWAGTGTPAVEGDGADVMATASFASFTTPITVFALVELTTARHEPQYIFHTNSDIFIRQSGNWGADQNNLSLGIGDMTTFTSAITPTGAVPRTVMLCLVFNGASSRQRVNLAQIGTPVNMGSAVSITQWSVLGHLSNGAFHLDGAVRSLIVTVVLLLKLK